MPVLAFDIYGTILDTSSITSGIETHLGLSSEKAGQLSQLWRRYQLEYTWRLNSMGLYEPFDVVTRSSLKHAAAESKVSLDDKAISALMETYSRLLPFDDAVPAFRTLTALPNVEVAMFSNGTEEMVATALQAALPEELLPAPLHIVGAVKRYKPAREVYEMLLQKVSKHPGATERAADVWLVSGNPFDVTGARAAGLGAIWVDRGGSGWTDHIPLPSEGLGPLRVVRDLGEIAALVGDLP
ncbi:haloacid dehalogenase [Wolfiporia cocos MD-104 SS10]|uniref:Haloacid dehalogenase n=1 Tax=Wolfiporia cocos (strain MD-104) TaxID=742152 RepID=A0A2H3J9K3_WOLCO|nr:haloacid dehalogenase [Wolfiporia cocos MD-104 SS10]